MAEKRSIRFLELLSIVHAIQDAASSIITGEGKFSRTTDALRKLQGILFPERAEELEEKAARTKKMLEKEMEKGPMKVQALDYAKTRRKKKRR